MEGLLVKQGFHTRQLPLNMALNVLSPPLLYWDLKYEYIKTAPYRHCVVKTPDVNFVTTVPLNGTLYSSEYSLRIEYITNKPVKIQIINPDGSILNEGEITGGKSC